jgi:HSP20 family protein
MSINTMIRPSNLPTHSLFDHLFEPFFESVVIPTTRKKSSSVDTKVFDKDNKFIISIAVPGLTKEDFNIAVSEGKLSVSCEEKQTEFGIHSFAKTWTLPEGTTAEAITAEYNQGILKVNVDKPLPQEPEIFTIEVK